MTTTETTDPTTTSTPPRRETHPVKPCPVCGKEFGRSRSESRATFDQRKTCSKSCAGRSRRDGGTSLPSSKKCAAPGCEVTFERKSYEGPQRWTARRFCSRPCSTNHRETHRVRVTPSTRSRPSRPRTRPASTPAPSSPFGDRPPAQPWRPAGFSATPNTRPGGAR